MCVLLPQQMSRSSKISSNSTGYEYVHRYVVAANQRATDVYGSRFLVFVLSQAGRGVLATTRSPVASCQFSTKQVWKGYIFRDITQCRLVFNHRRFEESKYQIIQCEITDIFDLPTKNTSNRAEVTPPPPRGPQKEGSLGTY